MRDALALVLLILELPVPLFWLLVHPRAEFWRRHPRTCYYLLAPAVWLACGLVLLGSKDWWLEERFSRHPLLVVGAAGLVAVEVWLFRRVERSLSWGVLVGFPELTFGRYGPGQLQGQVLEAGIYGRLRHPRYLGMILIWAAAVLLSGATRLLYLAAGFVVLALITIEVEEKELVRRFGQEYEEYRRRVPGLLPRLR